MVEEDVTQSVTRSRTRRLSSRESCGGEEYKSLKTYFPDEKVQFIGEDIY